MTPGFGQRAAEEMEPSCSDILRFAGYHGSKIRLTIAHAVGKARSTTLVGQ